MFKKLKDKLEEEFKQGPLKFPVSVQQLAQVISPSPSLNSLSDNAGSSATCTSDPSSVSANFFSIGDDDDSQDGSSKTLPLQSIDLTPSSPSNMTQSRSRRSSLSSVTSEASSLFPIFENPSTQSHFQSDLESEMEDGMPSQIEKISKEQLYQTYKKVFNRYNKYKGRYVDLQRHYKELLHDNVKTKNVLQESQDKALRRIAELKEQCQLEQNAKAHLEEALRNDVEDRDHMITTLKTKISLLRSGNGGDGPLVDVTDKGENDIAEVKTDELEKLKLENENLQKEITNLKKLKDTACHLIHRCDTTIEEATEDVNNENLKRKMSELKSEIEKMKSENESLSHLLSKNIIIEEDKKSQSSTDGSFLADLGVDSSQGESKTDEKDKKIEKLNNLLLKCKEKINALNSEIKSKNLIIEDKNKKFNELKDELQSSKELVSKLTAEMEVLKVREEENVLSVAENKMAVHKELEAKEEQIKALTKELKTSENEFRKEKDEITGKYEDKIKEMREDFSRDLKSKNEENEKLSQELKSKQEELKDENVLEKTKEWETELKKIMDSFINEGPYKHFIESKSAEFERAGCRLEERLSTLQKRVLDFKQTKERELEDKIKEITKSKDDAVNEIKNTTSAEYEHNVEKLNSDIKNLSQKIEELQLALAASEKRNEEVLEERNSMSELKDKLEIDVKNTGELKERVAHLEAENEKMKENSLTAEAENKRLGNELNDHMEKLKKAMEDKCMMDMINKEKTEAEKKLKEYIENYNKLEKENRELESDLNQKCEKLLKDLSDSKEKIKHLESENATKNTEIEGFRSSLSEAVVKNDAMKCELREIEKNMTKVEYRLEELSKMNKVLNDRYVNAMAELDSWRMRYSDMKREKSVMESENMRLRNELKAVEEQLKNVNYKNLKLGNDLKEQINALDTMKKELSLELKTLEEKLEGESKINENLGDKLQKEQEEKNVLKKEIVELKSKCQKLEEDIAKGSQEVESLLKENEGLKREMSEKMEELTSIKSERADLIGENEKLKLESVENEKAKSEATEKMKELLNERNEMSDSLQLKQSELETLKESLKSAKEELSEKVRILEEENQRLSSENENKLNVLKNEIKFMNNKFDEDVEHIEENRSVELNQLNERLVVAENASRELLEKLEKITTERDEGKTAVEERDMKITELEACMATLKAELDQKFNQGKTENEPESKDTTEGHETDVMRKEKEIQDLRAQNEEYSKVIQTLKSANERFQGIANLERTEKELNQTQETSDAKKSASVEDLIERERRSLTNAEKQKEMAPETDSGSIESMQKKVIQQAAEIRELQKQHKREVSELRKIISMKRRSRRNSVENSDWGGTLDNDTEHEYLRNILYEYMMGREQLVLAKVLSAIVKFDKQQTRNVLEKEQNRQTLFGQLGIL